jgi:cation efflux system membrane fusion protein
VSAAGFICFSSRLSHPSPIHTFPRPLLLRILQLAGSASLAATALLASPIAAPLALAHVGHGDEFQQQGDARQVRRNAETDALLGVSTATPEDGPDGLSVPSTALIDANGKPLLFVQTQTTYDPVLVVTGSRQGDRVVITEGIDPTDEVVISGALSLYAESKKTQQAEPAMDNKAAAQEERTTASQSALPVPAMAAGAAVVLTAGAIWLARRRKTDA